MKECRIPRTNQAGSWFNTALVCTAGALLVLLVTGTLHIPSPFLATLAVVVLTLFLPGLLLLGILNKANMPLPERIALSFALSLGLWSIPGAVFMRLHSSLELALWFVVSVTLLLCGIYLARTCLYRRSLVRTPTNPNPSAISSLDAGTVALGVAATVAILLMLSLVVSFSTVFQSSDRWTYTAHIRHYLDTGHFLNTGAYLSDTTPIPPRHSMSVWELLLAVIDRIAQVDLVDMYCFYLIAILMLTSFLAIYSLARVVLKSNRGAFIVCMVQTLYYLTSIVFDLGLLGYGQSLPGFDAVFRLQEDKSILVFIVLPVAQMLSFRYFSEQKSPVLPLLAVVAAALTFLHPMGLIVFGISFGAFAGLHLLLEGDRQKWLRALAMAAILLVFMAVPFIQWKEQTAIAYAGIYLTASAGIGLSVFSTNPDAYIVDPALLVHPPLILLGLLLTPLLIRYMRRDRGAQYLLSNALVVPLLLFNPVMAPLLSKLISTQTTWRIVYWLLPASMIVGYFVMKGTAWLLHRHARLGRVAHLYATLPILLILLGGILSHNSIINGIRLLYEFKASGVSPEYRDALGFIRDHGVPGSIVLAPEWMTYDIPSMVGHSYGLVFRDLPTTLPDAKRDLDTFFSSETRTLFGSRLSIVQQYGVRYIILPAASALNSIFGQLSPAFQEIYTDSEFDVFEATPGWQQDPLVRHIMAAGALAGQGRYDAATNECAMALQTSPDRVVARRMLVEVLVQAGRLDEAAAECSQLTGVLAAAPVDRHQAVALADAYATLAQIEWELGARSASLNLYQQALTTSFDSLVLVRSVLDAHFITENAASEQDRSRLDLLALTLDKAIELDPDHLQTYLTLAEIYQSLGRADMAQKAATRLLDHPWPNVSNAHYQVATYYESHGDIQNALTEYGQAIESNPRWAAPSSQGATCTNLRETPRTPSGCTRQPSGRTQLPPGRMSNLAGSTCNWQASRAKDQGVSTWQ